MMSKSFVGRVLDTVRNMEDGCEVTMRVITRGEEFKLLLMASDGMNTIDVTLQGSEAKEVYFNILDNVGGDCA